MEYKILSNGVAMPVLGYGTLAIPKEKTKACIRQALQAGYRLIDTAASYFNEEEIGQAILESTIPRDELFLTSKVWVQDAGYEETLKAFETSLTKLGLDYLDLYLIHQPYGDYYGSWRALEDLYQKKKVRAIGVCNFNSERFIDLYMNASIAPMINQVEYHPFFVRSDVKTLMKKCHCQLEAWGPLNEGQREIFDQPLLKDLAMKYGKTPAQIVLRWHIQEGNIAIPKTIHPERMIENRDIWDFVLDEEDRKKISSFDLGYSEIIDHSCYRTAKVLNRYRIHD